MTGTTENDPKAIAFEELRDRANRAGYDEGFASVIEALRVSLRDGKPLQNPTPSVELLANPEAASFDQVWQHYSTVGFGFGWTEGTNRLIELLTWLPKTMDGLDSHIRETRLHLASQNNLLPLGTPIEDLDFTVRTYNCLKREGVFTAGELLERSEATLIDIRNFGWKSVDEVAAKLATHGYQLKPSPEGFERP